VLVEAVRPTHDRDSRHSIGPPALVVVHDRDRHLRLIGGEDVDDLGGSEPGSDPRDPLHPARGGEGHGQVGRRRTRLLAGRGLHSLCRDQALDLSEVRSTPSSAARRMAGAVARTPLGEADASRAAPIIRAACSSSASELGNR
jgi:hypothetical protein